MTEERLEKLYMMVEEIYNDRFKMTKGGKLLSPISPEAMADELFNQAVNGANKRRRNHGTKKEGIKVGCG